MRHYRKYVRKKNRRREQIKRISLTIICIIILLLCAVVGVVFLGSENEEKTATPDNALTSATKNPEQIEVTSKSIEKTLSQEDTYEKVIEESTRGLDEDNEVYDFQSTRVLDDIGVKASEFDFEQLIVVRSNNTTAQISFFEKVDGVWEYSNELSSVDGYVGSQGVSIQASEYTQHTPSGLYSLGTAFGICDNPGTKMDYFNVTDNSYWIDDPNSNYYNQHVEGSEDADWQSAEHLIDYNPAYNYAVFIEYNTNPIIPGNGSAFFIHVGYEPTAGCVSMAENSMIQLLCWLNPEKKPHIFIM